jgi:hypothetical protein
MGFKEGGDMRVLVVLFILFLVIGGFGVAHASPGMVVHGGFESRCGGCKRPRVLVYYDSRYPCNWIRHPADYRDFLLRVFDRYNVSYEVVDAFSLVERLKAGVNAILVPTCDVLPDTVWNGTEESIVVKWLRSGGTIIWSGDWEFYYVGHVGSFEHRDGIENVPFGRAVTGAVEAYVRATDAGMRVIPSLTIFKTMRPFVARDMVVEAYGQAGDVFDPAAVRVGNGTFIKVGSTADSLTWLGFLYVAELVLNKYYNLSVKLTGECDFSYVGIVYILPSKASSPKWQVEYGDRIFFYVKEDVARYAQLIDEDFKVIAGAGYDFVILLIPLEDDPLLLNNIKVMDHLARVNGLEVLWLILPKWKYGDEWSYLTPGTKAHRAILDLMRFLSSLRSTRSIAVWYGWIDRRFDPEEIRRFYVSLPEELRRIYWVWLDEEYVPRALEAGMYRNISVVSELYDPLRLALYSGVFENQIVVTGVYNAENTTVWKMLMCSKLGFGKNISTAGVWIFDDTNDGWGQLFRAYINGYLSNPVTRIRRQICFPGQEFSSCLVWRLGKTVCSV